MKRPVPKPNRDPGKSLHSLLGPLLAQPARVQVVAYDLRVIVLVLDVQALSGPDVFKADDAGTGDGLDHPVLTRPRPPSASLSRKTSQPLERNENALDKFSPEPENSIIEPYRLKIERNEAGFGGIKAARPTFPERGLPSSVSMNGSFPPHHAVTESLYVSDDGDRPEGGERSEDTGRSPHAPVRRARCRARRRVFLAQFYGDYDHEKVIFGHRASAVLPRRASRERPDHEAHLRQRRERYGPHEHFRIVGRPLLRPASQRFDVRYGDCLRRLPSANERFFP